MKKFFFTLLFLIVAGGGALFYFNDFRIPVRITESQFESGLAGYYPVTETELEIFEVTYFAPDFTFREDGSDRVKMDMEIRLRIRGLPGPARYRGTVQIESGMRYDNESKALYLSDSEVSLAQVSGLNDNYWGRLKGRLGDAVSRYLDKNPVYEFDVAEAEAEGFWNKLLINWIGAAVKDITVEDRGLNIVLGI